MTAPDLTPITAAAVEVCDEHHWVASKQPDYPEWLAWLNRCSICGRYGEVQLREGWTVVPESFAAQVREDVARRIEAEAERTSDLACPDRSGMGPDYWAGMYDAADLARSEVSP